MTLVTNIVTKLVVLLCARRRSRPRETSLASPRMILQSYYDTVVYYGIVYYGDATTATLRHRSVTVVSP